MFFVHEQLIIVLDVEIPKCLPFVSDFNQWATMQMFGDLFVAEQLVEAHFNNILRVSGWGNRMTTLMPVRKPW